MSSFHLFPKSPQCPLTSGLGACGERVLPGSVTRVRVDNHADRVDGGRLQSVHGERVVGVHPSSGELDPSESAAAAGRVLECERQYAARLRRPRAECERRTG